MYPEFKSLFAELLKPLKITEPTALEYLRRALKPDLQYIIRGSKDRAEAWARLDENFADRVGQISTIMDNLANIDLSRGKMFQKVEKLMNEVKHLLVHLTPGQVNVGEVV